jgi:non-ribosomal peptide synthetase component E (peptide arylation enzyme)
MTAQAIVKSEVERAADALAVVDRNEQLSDLASAIGVLADNMQTIGAMSPDDVLVELDCERDGTKFSTRLRLRAYKHRPA